MISASELTKVTEEHIKARTEEVKEKILTWLYSEMLENAKNGNFNFRFHPDVVTRKIMNLKIDNKIDVKIIYKNVLDYLKNLGYVVESRLDKTNEDLIVIKWNKEEEGK